MKAWKKIFALALAAAFLLSVPAYASEPDPAPETYTSESEPEALPAADPAPEEDPPVTDPEPEEDLPATDPEPEEDPPATDPEPEEDPPVTDPEPEEAPPVTDLTPEEASPAADPVPETPTAEPETGAPALREVLLQEPGAGASEPPEDVFSVMLPTFDSETSLNFSIDPEHLIEATGAARYGGGTVEPGATLLFRNSAGEYDFSSRSDTLTVENTSGVPVRVTVMARIEEQRGDLRMSAYDTFPDTEVASIYMAMVDDQGDELPIPEGKEI